MTEQVYHGLRAAAKQYALLEKAKVKLFLQKDAWKRRWKNDPFAGFAADVVFEQFSAAIKEIDDGKSRIFSTLPSYFEDDPLGDFISETRGLGPKSFVVIGLLPYLENFPRPSGIVKYTGLHVNGEGRAPKKSKGSKSGWDPFLRSLVLYHVALPVRNTRGAYRFLYDARKERTLETHPQMFHEGSKTLLVFPECPTCQAALGRTKELRAEKNNTRERQAPALDCSNLGGQHWTAGHREADALRFMAKAILIDFWAVANNRKPRLEPNPA